MKKKLIFLSIFILIAYLLVFPAQAVHAAATGLILWYERVLPSLLPFAILSNILIYSNAISILMRYLYPVIRPFFPCSPEGGFVLLSGFLFGFPMGSKNCAELLKAGKLEKEEADLLFIITNNIGFYQQLYLVSGTEYSFAHRDQLSDSLSAAAYFGCVLVPLFLAFRENSRTRKNADIWISNEF